MRDITLIFGCMFSGKTTKLIELFNFSEAEHREKIAIKPLLDTRYIPHSINTHSGIQLPGHRISKPEEIYPLIESQHKEIYLDEVQFFNESIVNVLLDLSLQGIKIVAAGLDTDYRGEAFGPMPQLKKMAPTHIALKARCSVCNASATHTYRRSDSPDQVLIGHSDIYEARCEVHWKEGMEGLR